MCFEGRSQTVMPPMVWGDTVIPQVAEYKYLGVLLIVDGKWVSHVNNIILSGSTRLRILLKTFKCRYLSIRAKICLYKALVRPAVEFAAEVWHCNTTQTKQDEGLQQKVLRYILRIHSKTPLEATLGDLGMTTVQQRHMLV